MSNANNTNSGSNTKPKVTITMELTKEQVALLANAMEMMVEENENWQPFETAERAAAEALMWQLCNAHKNA